MTIQDAIKRARDYGTGRLPLPSENIHEHVPTTPEEIKIQQEKLAAEVLERSISKALK